VDGVEKFSMGATVATCGDTVTSQTRMRFIKYVLAGFAPAAETKRITTEELHEYHALKSRMPKWHSGMTCLEMAAHAMYLGGIQHYWFPRSSYILAELEECGKGPLADLFMLAGVKPTDFVLGGTYSSWLASPATMKPPHEVARLLACAEQAYTALTAVAAALASMKTKPV
jgi:hypothetical protein